MPGGKVTALSPAPIAATIALEMTRHTHQPLATGILARDGLDLVRHTLDPLIEPTPIASQTSIMRNMRGDRTSGGVARMRGSSPRKIVTPGVPQSRAPTGRRGFVDDAGALADQPLTYPCIIH